MLECGHPDDCWDGINQDCGWCSEVNSLERDVAALKSILHQKAVILEPGEHDLTVDTIGYLEMRGGNVTFHPPKVGAIVTGQLLGP